MRRDQGEDEDKKEIITSSLLSILVNRVDSSSIDVHVSVLAEIAANLLKYSIWLSSLYCVVIIWLRSIRDWIIVQKLQAAVASI